MNQKLNALNQVMLNSQLHCVGDHVLIECAICNAYRPAFVTCNQDDTELAKNLKALALLSNELQKWFINEKLATNGLFGKQWKKIHCKISLDSLKMNSVI